MEFTVLERNWDRSQRGTHIILCLITVILPFPHNSSRLHFPLVAQSQSWPGYEYVHELWALHLIVMKRDHVLFKAREENIIRDG